MRKNSALKTSTLDNDKTFVNHQKIAKALKIKT